MENFIGGVGARSGVGKYQELGSEHTEFVMPFRRSGKEVGRPICS